MDSNPDKPGSFPYGCKTYEEYDDFMESTARRERILHIAAFYAELAKMTNANIHIVVDEQATEPEDLEFAEAVQAWNGGTDAQVDYIMGRAPQAPPLGN